MSAMQRVVELFFGKNITIHETHVMELMPCPDIMGYGGMSELYVCVTCGCGHERPQIGEPCESVHTNDVKQTQDGVINHD